MSVAWGCGGLVMLLCVVHVEADHEVKVKCVCELFICCWKWLENSHPASACH